MEIFGKQLPSGSENRAIDKGYQRKFFTLTPRILGMHKGDHVNICLIPDDNVKAEVEYQDGRESEVVAQEIVYQGVVIGGVTSPTDLGECVVTRVVEQGVVLESLEPDSQL